eukprot:CAMPEP_0168598748 /NCGR_PEP_ID=MMETSP0420-20121227/11611_1 /TAXON_ID=498008 /ORGANISM="Pessonella sp." /LENGTH=411 /DNA_ID=CAMNT_0008636183 /DNA_START=75 /DNA_END=1310 /DNA_ORIENTATION=+
MQILSLFLIFFICLIAKNEAYTCASYAKLTIVESIPVQVDLKTRNTTWAAWRYLVQNAERTVDIAAFFVDLTSGLAYPPLAGGDKGDAFFNDVVNAVKRGVQVRLVQQKPSKQFPDTDSETWENAGVQVRNIDWAKLTPQHDGILHTKMIIVDEHDFYLGSANMAWSALTEVKELGLVVEDCELLARDALKIHEMYWEAAHYSQLPPRWPTKFDTIYNATNPARVTIGGESVQMFLSASPNAFDTPNRAHDGETIVYNINQAQQTIDVEVMDYMPFTQFSHPNFWWPNIDNALRRAAWRGVKVRLLFGLWEHSAPEEIPYWQSLSVLENVEVRVFRVPALKGSPPIPFTRVNHAKFMITEKIAYVGTSNWDGDYFNSTGGLGWTITASSVKRDMDNIFQRDWSSVYTFPCC